MIQEKCVNQFGTDYGKPKFPAVPTTTENDLSDFIEQDSLMFFTILKLDSSFLNHPVDDWINIESFKEAKEVVSNMCVVNDAAEWGVKLCHDFLPTAKKEKNLQNILQVVENCRNHKPNQRKRKLESRNWFLAVENE